jgi:beta-lactamase regulating signal transducer with metallopeptidase domain
MTSHDSALVAAAWSQLWQVTALILIVSAAIRTVGKARAHLSYVLWVLVILKCLTPPLWSSPTGLFGWLEIRMAANPPVPVPVFHALPHDDHQALDNLPASVAGAEASGAATAPGASEALQFPAQAVLACWLSGAVICGGIAALRWRRCRQMLRPWSMTANSALLLQTASLARRLGVRRPVRVVVVAGPYGPAALGLFSPTVVLPAALAKKSHAELEPILAHELIHLRRGDNLFGILQALTQILWWFHPLVWLANRSASRAIERCCDEEVIAGLECKPGAYARCLLDVLELKQSLKAVHLSPGMRPAEVTAQRLERIMTKANGFHRRTPSWCWALLALTAVLALPGKEIIYGQSQPEAQPPARTPDPDPEAGAPMPRLVPKDTASSTNSTRMVEAIRLQNALAADAAAAIKGVFENKRYGKKPTDKDREEAPAIIPEPISNHLFVAASPSDFAEIKRLVRVLDVAPKHLLIEVTVCEGEPVPTAREAADKGAINVLSRPQMMVVENQTALVNVGKEIEFPAKSGQSRQVGIILQVTPGRVNGKQVPVRLVNEVSGVAKDGAALDIQHMEHSANFRLGERSRIRGGVTNSGKDLWVEMTVTEVPPPAGAKGIK